VVFPHFYMPLSRRTPTTVQAEKATAQLKDGVLEVTIPKREETKAKDVPIQT
jgi:HSP20 family molecular chaperone IbpA